MFDGFWLFEASTGIDPEYRAQKLMERLTGQAWLATKLKMDSLKDCWITSTRSFTRRSSEPEARF